MYIDVIYGLEYSIWLRYQFSPIQCINSIQFSSKSHAFCRYEKADSKIKGGMLWFLNIDRFTKYYPV